MTQKTNSTTIGRTKGINAHRAETESNIDCLTISITSGPYLKGCFILMVVIFRKACQSCHFWKRKGMRQSYSGISLQA